MPPPSDPVARNVRQCDTCGVADLPFGTVAFLFADLEGSTRLWREHPEAMRPALARHDEFVRDAIVASDGINVVCTAYTKWQQREAKAPGLAGT